MGALIPPETGGMAVEMGLFEELLGQPGCACVLSSRVRVALPRVCSIPGGAAPGSVTSLFVRAVCFGGRAAVFILCLILSVHSVGTFYSECPLCARALT